MHDCYICHGSTDVQWCPTCKVWLCSNCRPNYAARIGAAIRKALGVKS